MTNNHVRNQPRGHCHPFLSSTPPGIASGPLDSWQRWLHYARKFQKTKGAGGLHQNFPNNKHVIIWSNLCFLNFLQSCSYLCQESRGPDALPGVVEDRRGWQWPPGWFLTWLSVIWSNFCLQNIVLRSFIWNLRCNSPLRNIPVLQGSRRKKLVLTPDFQNLG